MPATAALVPILKRRAALLLVAIVLLGTLMRVYAGGLVWPIVLYRLLTDGGLVVLWALACVGWGEAILRLARLASGAMNSALRFASAAALGIGVMSLVILTLGLGGALNRWTAAALLLGGLMALAIRLVRAPLKRIQWKEPANSWSWLLVLLVPFLNIAILGGLVPPGVLWGADDPAGYDVVEYHLQVPREWYEMGRIRPLEHNVYSYFPQGVEMHYLLAMHLKRGPWEGMYVAQWMHTAMVILAIVALYGTGQMIGGKAGGAIAALVGGSIAWMTMLAAVAYNEGALLLFGILAIAWTLRYLQSGAARDITVAGAMAGFACGAKLTGAPMVLLAIPVAMLFAAWSRQRVRGALIYVVTGVICFSPWLSRNMAWARNPFFPEAMSLFGRGHFSEQQVERWHAAHSPREDQGSIAGRAQALWVQIVGDWRYAWVPIPLGIVAMVLARKKKEVRFFALLLAILLIFWIGFTHLQSRFFIVAVPIVALAIARADWRWARPPIVTLLIITAAASMFHLHMKFNRFGGALGLDDMPTLLSIFVRPDERLDDLKETDRTIILVGDAKAFWYPFKRLRYRTVFDVDTSNTRDIFHAWLGRAPAPADAVVLIDTNELSRLRSYKDIPELPAVLSARGGVYRLNPELIAILSEIPTTRPAPTTDATATPPAATSPSQ